MKYHSQKQPKGFSLLELLLVLALIMAIMLASYHRFKQYILHKDIASIKHNVALLMDELNQTYYLQIEKYCPPKPPLDYAGYMDCPVLQHKELPISNSDLHKWPTLLPSNLVTDKTLTASSYGYNVDSSQGITTEAPPNYVFPSGYDTYYNHQLWITVTLDKNLIPEESLDWYQSMLGASKRDGYKLTWIKLPSYTVKGMNSDLWIMGGGLATFTKALEGSVVTSS
ncbi:MAG: prepilin-type N-terminal cleavage/methylation domain-containing protein [Gammaproteobacteria bacterium]|nr:prepilin-type N-terminal cleavage/methylation domain-containing protein [Gammaproteobacteria bacterium]